MGLPTYSLPLVKNSSSTFEVNENKISAKNAFELPLIEHMDDIVDSFMGGRRGGFSEMRKSGTFNLQRETSCSSLP